MTLKYRLATGENIPLFEGEYDFPFVVTKKHAKGATIADPLNCIEARAIRSLSKVEEAYIGSGRDAYVVFKETNQRPFLHAVHFSIPTKAGSVRDNFDKEGSGADITLWLRAPSNSHRLEDRRLAERARDEAHKHGKPIKKATKPKSPNAVRMERLGVAHRPRASVKGNIFSVG